MEGSHNAAAPTSNASTASSPCLQKRTATLELFNMCLVDPAPQQKRTATLELSNMRLVDPATPKKRACTRGVGRGVDEAGVGCGVDEAGVYLPYNVNAGYPPSLKLGCCKENVSDPPLLMLPPPCLAACSQVADEDTMSESNQGGGGGGLDFKLSVKLFSGANEADGQEDQQLALLEIVVDGGNVVVGGDVDGDKREHHIAVLDRSRSMEGPRMKNLISALVTYIEVCVYWFCFLIGRSIYV